MKSVDEMIVALEAAGWDSIAMRFYGLGYWRAEADKTFPSGNRKFCEVFGSTFQEAVRKLCRDCLGEEWE